jgi:diaminopimelate decarboxylase
MAADAPAHIPDLRELLSARPVLEMDAQDGLCFEYVPLNAIADAHGTPVWVYGAATMRARYSALTTALSSLGLNVHVHYAVKANDHLAILDLFRRLGAGADVVSLGEFMRTQRAGIDAKHVVFSGVGKSPVEIASAIASGVGQINVESLEELNMIAGIAAGLGRPANVALRMNPDVDAGTHEKITTGLAGNKFGIAAGDIPFIYAHATKLTHINPVGIAMHIGSQILSPAPYAAAFAKAAAMVRHVRDLGNTVSVLDLGGGLGIGYGDEPGLSLPAYANLMHRELGDLRVQLMIEPGRYLVGPAGMLLGSVILEKWNSEKRFIVLDTAMNDLMRPAMYEAWHGIVPLSASLLHSKLTPADVVGPVCETADCFAANRLMPEMAPGSRIAILDAGAYGAVMSSTYNARPRAASVMVDGGRFHLITPRQKVEDLWADETLPSLTG